MTDIWTYSIGHFDSDIDIEGYTVHATDGDIGKVDEATYQPGNGYLIVDTGPWIFGKKVLLPAGIITAIDYEEEAISVSRSKEEIKAAPEFNPQHQGNEALREPSGEYYRALWTGL